MLNRPEFITYDSAYDFQIAQAFLEVFTTPPVNEVLSLNEALTQLQSDSQHPGFGGLLVRIADEIVGFSWWFDISGQQLYERWSPRFAPKANIPQPAGRGAFLVEFGVVPRLQNRGLGCRLFKGSLEQIEPDHDWVAVSIHKFVHAGLALLKSEAFEELDLTGIQVPTRICLLKTIRR